VITRFELLAGATTARQLAGAKNVRLLAALGWP
jgi:hypothetical protein